MPPVVYGDQGEIDYNKTPSQYGGTAAQKQFVAEIRKKSQGQSEDFGRFPDAQIAAWQPWYDPASGKFRSMRGAPGLFDKPTECPPGQSPGGPDETSPCVPNAGGGGGGFGGGGGYGWGGNSAYGGGGGGMPGGGGYYGAGAPPAFTPPTPESVLNDPGYKFRLQQGLEALQNSAAARGMLRTGETLHDIVNYGQGAASDEYSNAYQRALQGWQTQYQPWNTLYQGGLSAWGTQGGWDLSKYLARYGGDLQKYLQQQNQIYGLINTPPPTMPVYQ
jgi:hypothetical protein